VDVSQVVLDRLRTEEDGRCSLARRLALRKQQRDLKLLRRQLVERRHVAAACGFAGRGELGRGRVGPRRRTQARKRLVCRAQMLTRFDAPTDAAEARAVCKLRSGWLEDIG